MCISLHKVAEEEKQGTTLCFPILYTTGNNRRVYQNLAIFSNIKENSTNREYALKMTFKAVSIQFSKLF